MQTSSTKNSSTSPRTSGRPSVTGEESLSWGRGDNRRYHNEVRNCDQVSQLAGPYPTARLRMWLTTNIQEYLALDIVWPEFVINRYISALSRWQASQFGPKVHHVRIEVTSV